MEEAWEFAALMPTIYRKDGCRVFFFSKEGPRAHVHVQVGDGKVKVWLDDLSTRNAINLSKREIRDIVKLVARHRDDFQRSWDVYFKS